MKHQHVDFSPLLSPPQLISTNQQAFIDLLEQGREEGEGGGSGGGGGEGSGSLGLPPGTMAIQVTQEEKAAIDRVRRRGGENGDACSSYQSSVSLCS